jgi:very-short-patch-repair endonuclease
MSKSDCLITNLRELPYNPRLKDYSREMRKNSTWGEITFWCDMLRKRKTGYQFNRQKIIGNYIVDFYCAELKLVVEIDGTIHDEQVEYDKQRDKILNSMGLLVIHYEDHKVKEQFEKIEEDFKKRLKDRAKELGVL